jgi:heat shock protein HslJ
MSTEDLDDRLHAAAEHWRAANATVANVDFGQLAIADEPMDVPVTPSPEVAPHRRRRMRGLLAAGVGVAAAVAATIVAISLGGPAPERHDPAPATTGALVGVDWRLAQIAGPRGAPLAVSAPLMIDKNGKLTGTDGCNHVGADAKITGDTIKLGAVVSTEMACVNRKPGFAAQVALLDAVLSGTVQWSVQGDELTLSKDGIAALVYRAAPPPTTDPKALVGIDWQLTVMAGAGPDATASTPAAPAAVRFDGKGHLPGSDGCNSMGGNVTITPGHLDDVAIGGTLMECPGARHDQYTLMHSVLRGSSIWDIADGQLTITKAGVGSLSWHAAPGLSPTSPRS